MPESRTSSITRPPRRRSRVRNLRRSVRLAQSATRKALEELQETGARPAPSRQSLRDLGATMGAPGGTSTRPILRQTDKFLARATFPSIEFAVSPQGNLLTQDVRGTARHEIAHHLGAGHIAMRAVAGYGGWLTAEQVPRAVRAQQESVGRRIQRARHSTRVLQASKTRRHRPSSFELALPLPAGAPRTPGFATPGLHRVERLGTPSQRERARRLQERLGRRARKKEVDF